MTRRRRTADGRLRVMTLVGTRPEVIKMSRIIAELDRRTDHVLVHSGQNFDDGLNGVFFRELDIRTPDLFLDVADRTAARTIGNVIARADEAFARVKPDALVLYGDTNSCLAAIAAKRRRIPIFHLEAGNRCFDDRVPEEVNRRIIDHTSDINLPLTERARQYLLAEGLRPETVVKIGSTMREVIDHYRPGIEASTVLDRLRLQPGRYFVVSAHREENVDDPERLGRLLTALDAMARRHRRRVVMSTHPRTRKRLSALWRGKRARPKLVEFLPPFGFLDWVQLQRQAFCVVSDSGTLTEEAALLGFPAVMIREAHERPEGMEAGVAVMSGLQPARVLQAVELVTSQEPRTDPSDVPVADYADRDVSRKVVRIVLSYVDYVRRTTWFETPG